MFTVSRTSLTLLILASLWPSPPGLARDRSQDQARYAREMGQIVPLSQILEDAQRRHPGRVVEVELDDDEYEIEILRNDGRVVELEYDARTGRLLKTDIEGD